MNLVESLLFDATNPPTQSECCGCSSDEVIGRLISVMINTL